MEARLRKRFNAGYSAEAFAMYSADLERRLGSAVGFRVAETPVFLTEPFRANLLEAAAAIVAQLRDSARLARMRSAVPERWNVPRPSPLPTFLALDFAAVSRADGSIVPRLVELQGFPSLLAYEIVQGDAWEAALQRFPGLGGAWTASFAGLDRDALIALARDVIVANHDPRNVVLLDIDPPSQKTSCDFAATRRLFGVDAVSPKELTRRGRRLFRRSPQGDVPVERIYNRMIADEVERSGTALPFDPREELDVEWTPHPVWFFIWSKHALPFLDHPAVPRTAFLSDLNEIPADVEQRYVLKPLFSFAGSGVNVRPTAADLAAIGERERSAWCLQEKVAYAPVILAPDGGAAKVEVRMMLLRRDDDAEFVPAINLCRLTRGEMVGVDYNREAPWTGSSIGLWRPS